MQLLQTLAVNILTENKVAFQLTVDSGTFFDCNNETIRESIRPIESTGLVYAS